MQEPPVIVLGGGVTGLGVLRILARQQIASFAVFGENDFATRSRFYRRLPNLIGAITKIDSHVLAAVLEGSGLATAVLMPCSDHWSTAVAGLSAPLRLRFPSSTASLDVLTRINDKGQFAALLQQVDVPHPRTLLLRGPQDIDAQSFGPAADMFLKPRDSQSFFRIFGCKAFRVSDLGEARDKLAQTAAHGLEMVLQEYIPGGGDQHYFVDGFRDSAGNIRAMFARRRTRMYPPDFGNSTAQISIDVATIRPAVDAIAKVLAHVNYRGIFSVEQKLDPRDGSFRILEINTRPWWYVDFAARCGIDVCRLAYDDALGRPLKTIDTYQVGATHIYPYYDYFAVQHLRSIKASSVQNNGERKSWVSWLLELTHASQPVFSISDVMPALTNFLRMLKH